MANTFSDSAIKNLIAIEKQMNAINDFIPNLQEINSSLGKINNTLRSSNILAIQDSLKPYYSMIENINNSVSMPQLTTVSNLINANTRLNENLNLLNRIEFYNSPTETIDRNSLKYQLLIGEIRQKSSEFTPELITLDDNVINPENKSTFLMDLKKITNTNYFTKENVSKVLVTLNLLFSWLIIQFPDNEHVEFFNNFLELIIALKALIDLFN